MAVITNPTLVADLRCFPIPTDWSKAPIAINSALVDPQWAYICWNPDAQPDHSGTSLFLHQRLISAVRGNSSVGIPVRYPRRTGRESRAGCSAVFRSE